MCPAVRSMLSFWFVLLAIAWSLILPVGTTAQAKITPELEKWCEPGTKDPDRAIRVCTKYIDQGKLERFEAAIAYMFRGQIFLEDKGEYTRAIADFQTAAQLNPLMAEMAPEYVDKASRLLAQEKKQQRIAEEAEARRQVEEARRRAAEAEAARKRAAEEAEEKRKAEEELRIAAEAQAKRTAEEVKRLATLIKQKGSAAAPSVPLVLGRRIALVIGNAKYNHATRLRNPANDIRDVAAAFRRLGFAEVIELYDLDKQRFVAELKSFGDKAAEADWAVVYYSGHGIQVEGQSYLIPTDARLIRASHTEDEAIPLNRVLSKVRDARKFRLVVLDACRDNPFLKRMEKSGGTRSFGRGLALIEPTRGVLVAYAARDGQLAQDGEGKHSPFTEAFLKHLKEPGIEIGLLFRKVRDSVLKRTGRSQEPFTYGSLPSEGLYFSSAGAQ